MELGVQSCLYQFLNFYKTKQPENLYNPIESDKEANAPILKGNNDDLSF